jgi:hypothetical protein
MEQQVQQASKGILVRQELLALMELLAQLALQEDKVAQAQLDFLEQMVQQAQRG